MKDDELQENKLEFLSSGTMQYQTQAISAKLQVHVDVGLCFKMERAVKLSFTQ